MQDFSAWTALAGGCLLGLGASLLLLASGQLAGVSGIVAGLVLPRRGDIAWRVAFVAGLLLAGVGLGALLPQQFGDSPAPIGMLAIAGLLVGIGTRLGSGCTSGHGVCGVSRLSPRSIVATFIFVATAMVTVVLARALVGVP